MGLQKIAPRKNSDDLERICASDNRKTTDPLPGHTIGSVAKRTIVVDHDRGARDSVANAYGFRVRWGRKFAACEDADQLTSAIDHGEAAVIVPIERSGDIDQQRVPVERDDGARTAHEPGFERDLIEMIGGVIAQNANAASNNFLGHDRVFHKHR